jgi:hypothetical protein
MNHNFERSDAHGHCAICGQSRSDHNKKQPDVIIDIRVRVPYGHRVLEVIAVPNDQTYPRNLVCIESINPAIDPPAPTFEIGKTYRTAAGHIMNIVREFDGGFIGKRQDPYGNLPTDLLINLIYDRTGVAMGDNDWSNYRLLPGAIEDEKPAPLDGNWKELPDRVDDLGAEHVAIRGRLDALERRQHTAENELGKGLSQVEERMDGLVLEGGNRWRAIHGRLDANSEKITQVESDADHRMTSLDQRINDAHKRTDLILNKAEVADAVERLDARYLGEKRTIKGGWVNVWAHEQGGRVAGPQFFDTKEDADHSATRDAGRRIACIHIPDITEGEGL